MPIHGLTNKSSLGRIEVSVFKGARKTDRAAGKDLGDRLRIATDNKVAATILRRYLTPDTNGDFYTESLNIYFPFDECERTFDCSMKVYSASGLELVCDRSSIIQRCIREKDEKGNVWRPIREVNEPCPMRDRGFSGECPNKCVKEGQLFFYIRELMDYDQMLTARITVHGFEDITYLSTELEKYRQIFGSLTRSPFPSPMTKQKIPFILSRTEVEIKRPLMQNNLRTGKKTTATTWALSLTVDPRWMALYSQWQIIQEMEKRAIAPDKNQLRSLLLGDATVRVIEAQAVEVPPQKALPSPEETRKKMLARINQLVEEYVRLTGVDYYLEDLTAKSEDEIIDAGKRLAAEVQRLRREND